MPPPRRRRFNAIPQEWGRNEKDLFVKFVNNSGADKFDINNDEFVRVLYDQGLFNWNWRDPEDAFRVQTALTEYLEKQYGVDFVEVFDWKGYRDAYEKAAISRF